MLILKRITNVSGFYIVSQISSRRAFGEILPGEIRAGSFCEPVERLVFDFKLAVDQLKICHKIMTLCNYSIYLLIEVSDRSDLHRVSTSFGKSWAYDRALRGVDKNEQSFSE